MDFPTHPDFDNKKQFIKALSMSGFFCSSYKNDTCPSVTRWINENQDLYIRVFIDYKDKKKREYEDYTQFCVELMSGAEILEHYNIDKFKQVEKVIKGLIDEN